MACFRSGKEEGKINSGKDERGVGSGQAVGLKAMWGHSEMKERDFKLLRECRAHHLHSPMVPKTNLDTLSCNQHRAAEWARAISYSMRGHQAVTQMLYLVAQCARDSRPNEATSKANKLGCFYFVM